jgi:hypothetical protein
MRRASACAGVARSRSSATCVLAAHSASERKSLLLLLKPHVVASVLADREGQTALGRSRALRVAYGDGWLRRPPLTVRGPPGEGLACAVRRGLPEGRAAFSCKAKGIGRSEGHEVRPGAPARD